MTPSYKEIQPTTLMKCIWHGNTTRSPYTSRGKLTSGMWRMEICLYQKLFSHRHQSHLLLRGLILAVELLCNLAKGETSRIT